MSSLSCTVVPAVICGQGHKPVGTVEQVKLCILNVYIVCINWCDNNLEVFNIGQDIQWNKMEYRIFIQTKSWNENMSNVFSTLLQDQAWLICKYTWFNWMYIYMKNCLHNFLCHVWRIGVQRESHIDINSMIEVCILGGIIPLILFLTKVELMLQHGAWSCVAWLISFSFCYSFLRNFSFARLLYVNFENVWKNYERME